MDTLCRVCIAKVAKGTSLSSKIEESSNLSFFDFLNKCTTLNAREGDKLPQSICSVCDNAMKMFYSFVTQAEKSDLVLKEVLKIIVPKRKYNSHKGTPCGESAKTKEITPNENPTGPSVFILDIVKEEPQPSESTSVVAVKGAEIKESEHCESNPNHPEKDNEESDDVVLCTDPHPAGIETVDLTDFENDIPTNALRRIIAISDDEADSERKPCEEETLANEIIGEESEDFNQGDSLHCQPSKNSTESLPYILDIVKEEPRMSESTSIVAVKDAVIDESVNSESNQDYPKVLDDMLLCTDSLPASIDTEETDSADDSPISLLKNSEQSTTFSAKESSCRNHSGDKGAKEKMKFKCEICGKRFTKNYLESYHMESHKGDKSKCDKCGKVFLHRYSLNRHMKWHNNPKASMCKICYKWLSSHESHARHMKKVHPEHPVTPKYDCGICDKSFSSQYYFDIHMEKHKTIEQKCHKCGKEFKQKHNLKRHMQLHDKPGPFKCEKCGRCYDRRYIYNGHIKICKHPGKQKQLKTKQLSSRSKKKKVVVSHESAALKKCQKLPCLTSCHVNVYLVLICFKVDTLCRVCNKKASKCTLLNSKIENSSSQSYLDFLNKCTTLNAREGDSLPQSLCLVCASAMRTFYSFVKLAERSDLVLREALVAEGRYKGLRGIPCEEITIRNEKMEENSFHSQPSENPTGSSLYILEIVKEEPRICDSTPSVTGFNESENFESNLDYPESSIEEPDAVFSDSEDDVPITLLRSRLAKIKEEADSEDISYEEIPIKNEKIAHECEICGKIFRRKHNFKVHLGIHNGIRHKCDQCGKEFKHIDTLRKHMRWHTNPKPFKCEICGKSLSTKRSWARHMRKVHPEHPVTLKYDCGICDKSFSSQYCFDIHMEKHKTIEQKCHKCGKEFKQKYNLNRHMKLHDNPAPFKCEKCGRCYDRRYKYNGHIKICKRSGKQKQLKTKQLSSPSKKKKDVVSHESAALI